MGEGDGARHGSRAHDSEAFDSVQGLLDRHGDEGLDIALGPAPEQATSVLRDAVASRRQVEVEYYSFGRDEITRRVMRMPCFGRMRRR